MTEENWQQLEDASREELISCIRVLATSVVQHRGSASNVGLRTSAEAAHGELNGNTDPELFSRSTALIEETLEIIRTRIAQRDRPDGADELPEAGDPESRTQYRIYVALPVKLLWPEGGRPVEAQLENISWGGASVQVPQGEVRTEDTVRLILARPQGGSIAIESRVLRSWPLDAGAGFGMALRFASLNTRDEVKLEGILEQLAQASDQAGRREHARLTERLDLQFDGIEELRSTLNDISAGGLGITVKEPLQIGQSLQAIISTLDTNSSLKLRARVVRQEPLNKGIKVFYRVGLKFEHPTDELQRRTSQFIQELATSRR